MKIIFQILCLLIFSTGTFAQVKSIVWGEEYKDRGYYSIIGESEDAFFVERIYNANFKNREVDRELLRFDKDCELTHGVEVRDIEKSSYESIATVNTPEGLAHIYYQTTKKGQHFVSAQLFDHKTLRKTEIVDLATFKIYKNSQRMVRQDGNFEVTFPLDVITSRDKTKLAIMFDQEKVGKQKVNYHQYCVIDLTQGLGILQQGDFFSDDQSRKYSISDRHLSNSGKLTYAIKKYVKNNSTEHINKKPAYDYEIHHMSGDSMEYIYDIKVRKSYIDKLILGTDNEDNLYISGFMRKQPFGDVQKSFLMGLDNLGYERFTVKEEYTKRDIKKIVGKERKTLYDDFETIDIFPTDDIVYVVRQYRRRNSRNNTFNNTGFRNQRFNTFDNLTYFWDYDEVIIEGFGRRTGEKLWTIVNDRENEDDNEYSRYFITGQYELVNNDLYLIYNEREENMIRIRRKENLKRTDIPGDQTAVTIARINSFGEIQYQLLDQENHFHLPEEGAFIGKESIYLFKHHKNLRRFYVGNADKQILDF